MKKSKQPCYISAIVIPAYEQKIKYSFMSFKPETYVQKLKKKACQSSAFVKSADEKKAKKIYYLILKLLHNK